MFDLDLRKNLTKGWNVKQEGLIQNLGSGVVGKNIRKEDVGLVGDVSDFHQAEFDQINFLNRQINVESSLSIISYQSIFRKQGQILT